MSEWKAHDGGPQPEETKGKMVFLFLRDGTKLPTPRAANALEWIDDGSDSAISLYRVLSDAHPAEEVEPANDGGAVFPQSLSAEGPFGGMTLRAYIATETLPAVIALCCKEYDPASFYERCARHAVAHADALIAALAARKEK